MHGLRDAMCHQKIFAHDPYSTCIVNSAEIALCSYRFSNGVAFAGLHHVSTLRDLLTSSTFTLICGGELVPHTKFSARSESACPGHRGQPRQRFPVPVLVDLRTMHFLRMVRCCSPVLGDEFSFWVFFFFLGGGQKAVSERRT